MENIKELIEQVKKGKALRGKNLLLKYFMGGTLTPAQAIKAHCYDCQGYYDNGAEDCGVEMCPLYPFAPYADDAKRHKRTVSRKREAQLYLARAKVAGRTLSVCRESLTAQNNRQG